MSFDFYLQFHVLSGTYQRFTNHDMYTHRGAKLSALVALLYNLKAS
jgi:hypothetical protein